MEDDIFSAVRQKIKQAGTDDPLGVADYYDIMWIPITGRIMGYAASYHHVLSIGVNRKLTGSWFRFAAWHELGHIFAGHVTEGGNIPETGYFKQEVDSLLIPRHEREANLISADMCVRDDDVYDVSNYNSETITAYRRLKSYQEKMVSDFNRMRDTYDEDSASALLRTQMEDLRNRIIGGQHALSDMETELNALNCCKTFHEMACELDVNERILRYKLEAMRLRGLDIDRQELESYSRMFEGAMKDA